MAHFTSLRGNKDAEMPISLYCCAPSKQRRASNFATCIYTINREMFDLALFLSFFAQGYFSSKTIRPAKKE